MSTSSVIAKTVQRHSEGRIIMTCNLNALIGLCVLSSFMIAMS